MRPDIDLWQTDRTQLKKHWGLCPWRPLLPGPGPSHPIKKTLGPMSLEAPPPRARPLLRKKTRTRSKTRFSVFSISISREIEIQIDIHIRMRLEFKFQSKFRRETRYRRRKNAISISKSGRTKCAPQVGFFARFCVKQGGTLF